MVAGIITEMDCVAQYKVDRPTESAYLHSRTFDANRSTVQSGLNVPDIVSPSDPVQFVSGSDLTHPLRAAD